MAKKKRGNKVLFILLAIVAALIVIVKMRGGGEEEGLKVSTEKATQRTIVEKVEASGKIFPEVEIKISSDVSGEIVDLFVEEGDSIKAGKLLARVKPETYKTAVERAEAAVNTSKANLAGAKAQEEQMRSQILQLKAQLENNRAINARNEQLFSEGIISSADLEASRATLKASEANLGSLQANLKSSQENVKAANFGVKSAEATVREANQNLAQTTIYAPSSGVISLLNVEKGERVVGTLQMTGTEIMRIANMNNMEVQVEVSENDVLRVKLGDTTDIEVDAYLDRTFQGVVTQIANSSNTAILGQLNTDQVTNFTVKIRILPSSYQEVMTKSVQYPFRPGMSASVNIRTNTVNKTLCVPIQAVTTREDEDAEDEEDSLKEIIFVYSADTVASREVKTGIQDDKYIQILSGLKAGEEIIEGPYSAISKKLEDGSKVKKTDKDELFGKKKKSK